MLVVGGTGSIDALSSAERYDPDRGSWAATGSMVAARLGHTATLLPDGAVLVAGGAGSGSFVGNMMASAELYDPSSGSWAATGRMDGHRTGHAATLLRDGTVLVAGGFGGSGRLTLAELYDPSSRSWTATGGMIEGRARHTATLLQDGTVLVTGGFGAFGPLASTELYDPR
jgi:N-acetylneuraminic acid mutarotase